MSLEDGDKALIQPCTPGSTLHHCIITRQTTGSKLIFTYPPRQGFSPRPTPPRLAEKQAALPRKKQALPRPAPQKLTKPAGRSRAKLTVDYTDYAHTFGLRVGQ